jgi:hypothetical protein
MRGSKSLYFLERIRRLRRVFVTYLYRATHVNSSHYYRVLNDVFFFNTTAQKKITFLLSRRSLAPGDCLLLLPVTSPILMGLFRCSNWFFTTWFHIRAETLPSYQKWKLEETIVACVLCMCVSTMCSVPRKKSQMALLKLQQSVSKIRLLHLFSLPFPLRENYQYWNSI